jgi:hypothetical protein
MMGVWRVLVGELGVDGSGMEARRRERLLDVRDVFEARDVRDARDVATDTLRWREESGMGGGMYPREVLRRGNATVSPNVGSMYHEVVLSVDRCGGGSRMVGKMGWE